MARSKVDYIGRKFGRLLITDELKERDKYGGRVVVYKCDCGNTGTTIGSRALCGITKSCGCLASETLLRRAVTHGKSNCVTYQNWENMKQRCYNEKNHKYPSYGGRGIEICLEWRTDFDKFLEDMGHRPGPEYSIDRIDNDKGYFKDNCRWATKKEQANNRAKRGSRIKTVDIRTKI